MFIGTFDGSIPQSLQISRNGQTQEKYEEMLKTSQEVAIGMARMYQGSYSREEMEEALRDLISEDGLIDCSVLYNHIKNACDIYAEPVVVKVHGEEKNIYLRWKEINGILRTIEGFDLLTRNFLHGVVYWVCQGQEGASYYSCLEFPYFPVAQRRQIYFLNENFAREYMKIFAKDKDRSREKYVYLFKVTAVGNSFITKPLEKIKGE